MTYPPQPGQNDPYGRQPPYGQQPQYEQQPQQPPYGQQPYGQQFPQTGPQPQAYGGFGTYGPPPRKRGPLPWILAGGGVVVIAVVVVLIIVLTGGDSAGESPNGTADALASALNAKDINAVNKLLCGDEHKLGSDDADGFDGISNVRVKSVSEPQGDSATAVLTATVDGKDEDEKFPMRKQDGKWCVSEPGGSGSSSSSPSDSGSSGGAGTPTTG
jgi:hypothetical protein